MLELKDYKVRAGRELTEWGGHGVNRKLQRVENTAAVCWTRPPASSSYVLVDTGRGGFPGFELVSINGIGEIRWVKPVTDEILKYPLELWNADYLEAFHYFFEHR